MVQALATGTRGQPALLPQVAVMAQARAPILPGHVHLDLEMALAPSRHNLLITSRLKQAPTPRKKAPAQNPLKFLRRIHRDPNQQRLGLVLNLHPDRATQAEDISQSK